MSSTKEFMLFVQDQLEQLDGVSFKSMMGEYAVYYKDKVVGAIFDDILLVKPVESAINYMKEINYYAPKYLRGAEWLIVDEIEDRDYLVGLFNTIYDEIPLPKKSKKKN